MDSIRQYFKRTDKMYLLLCIFSSVMAVLALSSWAAKQGNGFATDEVTGAIIGIGDYRRALVQAGAAAIGIVIALLLSCVDYRSLVKVWPVHVVLTWGLVLPTLVIRNVSIGPLTIGYNAGDTDNYSWYKLGGFTFQPTELAKISFILTFAMHLNNVRGKINEPKELGKLLLHMLVPILIIHIQGDDGTAIIYGIIACCMMFSAGLSWKYIIGAISAAAAAVAVAFGFFSDKIGKGYQWYRILAVIDPENKTGTAIVLTALLGWFMVSIAIRRPVKIAASISPIEAVRFTGNQSGKAHTHKKNMRLNPLSMGIANFRRDRKKTISIVASLSLGGVILLVTASILLVRSPERIARQYFPDGDYKIYIHSEKTEYEVMSKGNPLNEALRQEVLAVDGVTDVIENRQAVHVRFENEESSSGGMCDLLSDRNRDQMEAALVSGTLPQDSHSIALDMDYAEDMIGVDVGSVIKLTIGDQEIPVTVSGLLINDGLKNGHGPLALDSTCIVATKELFQEAMPMIDCFDYSWSIVSDPQKAEQIENSLSAIISSNPDLDLDTIGIHKDYEEMENRVVFGGFQALSWLVFLFGVVNLINTTLSNQMSRKRENSVFRAIGLTRKQLCQMTIYEGICYAFFAALATLAVGLPIAVIAARKFSEMTFFGAIMPYSFPFLQMGLFVLVLFGLEVILSFWTMRRQKNQSLVEEMRAME